METEYIDALESLVDLEASVYGEPVNINGIDLTALVSLSGQSKNLRTAGFYRNQVLDIVVPKYSEEPDINQRVVYNSATYVIKEVERLEFGSANRILVELLK